MSRALVEGSILAALAGVSSVGCSKSDQCGTDSAFDVVPCGNSFDPSAFCPANSACVGTDCVCAQGFVAVDCSGNLCNGTCIAPGYECEPLDSVGSGGGSGGTGGGEPGVVPETPAAIDAGVASAYGTACPAGTTRCGEASFCCPTGEACLANPNDEYGCHAGFCCFGCPAANVCGSGCCNADQVCTAGGSCGETLCCTDQGDPPCDAASAAACAPGTTCLYNRSSVSCSGEFACYLPSGGVGCPGDVLCPNGSDFCPAGNECEGVSGTCLVGSSGDNYCCKPVAGPGQSCDSTPCETGSTCVPNNDCPDSDPSATNVCYGPCGGSLPVDCSTYCCSQDTTCAGDCYCN